ncbi:DUF4391 domain-containing protein [Rhizobium etli]|uniref:Methyl-accepting chemotaxis protein n=1 Tax=Rhizobium etli TaxID=29449 RepID=A0A7W6ZFJ9_RHIET|nr:DUF4391 domain-containing protein [Rhizobium etli]MBB4478959.1 hypothetical protein [Rhizobium etli]MBB4534847.1 hypothetical protein [Rhizobium etli]
MLYDWPRATAFGRVIPKNKIYEHAGASTALKDLFVREVDQIVWAHKLAPETINLPASKSVTEIQVFRIAQREGSLDMDALRAIDRAIPFPLLFELVHNGRVKLAVAYKRPSEADSSKWVLGDYFEGPWQPEDAQRMPLPVALNMGALYELLLRPLVEQQAARLLSHSGSGFAKSPFGQAPSAEPVPLEARIAHAEAVKVKTREIERIKMRLAREKQFNKRIAINTELRAAKQELERLLSASAASAPIQE